MKAGGAICCLWLGLYGSQLYGQHLSMMAPPAADAESQTVATAYVPSNTPQLAFGRCPTHS